MALGRLDDSDVEEPSEILIKNEEIKKPPENSQIMSLSSNIKMIKTTEDSIVAGNDNHS